MAVTAEKVIQTYETKLKEKFVHTLSCEQAESLTNIVNKKNVLTILPTGQGKTLIYAVLPEQVSSDCSEKH